MSKLKILQLFSRYLQYGGEEESVFRMGDTLAARYDVDYFVESSEDMIRNSGLLLPLHAYRNFPVLKKLEEYHRNGKFDCWLIHNVFPAISPGAYTLARNLDVPIIHFLHNYRMGCVNGIWYTQGQECRKCADGNFIHGALGKCWRDSFGQSSAMALMLADTRRRGLFQQVRRWVAISHSQKAAHVRIGLPEERIDVVHHFLEPGNPAEIPEFPADGYGLFIGRLSPEKGVDRLLDAWALLGRDRRLVVAGDGPELTRLQERAAALGLPNVRFAGFVKREDQHELWAGAAFSIVPSMWQEPFGMVVLEAWARCRPVVAHRIGALPEIITDGVDGFLADPGNAADLARTIKGAFDAGPSLQDLGRNGFDRLKARFNKSLWLDRMAGVYRNAGLS